MIWDIGSSFVGLMHLEFYSHNNQYFFIECYMTLNACLERFYLVHLSTQYMKIGLSCGSDNFCFSKFEVKVKDNV